MDFIEDPVLADADPVGVQLSSQLHDAGWPRIGGESFDVRLEPLPDLDGDFPQVAQCPGCQFEAIGHDRLLQTQLGLGLLPRYRAFTAHLLARLIQVPEVLFILQRPQEVGS